MARWNSCNVLLPGPESRRLWQFNGSGKFNLLRAETKLPGEPLPEKLVGKDWQTVFQPRLNIAWLASDKVFLRVLQIPKGDVDETRSMVDLQMEKISPLPVAQIVWSFEVVPMTRMGTPGEELSAHATGELQTVIVIMIARHHVEEYLGQLEGQGYLADRLELPLLDQLLGLKIHENGVWIFPGLGTSANACVIGWWFDGVLQNVAITHLPVGEHRGAVLQEQLAQTSWAGEVEGWLTSEPKYHLIADEATAAAWLPLFTSAQPVEVIAPPADQVLAQIAARRVVAQGSTTNLLPPEFAARYKQRLVDRLWMRSLGAVIVLYMLGVVVYYGFVKVAEFRYNSLQAESGTLGVAYTNTIRIKERMTVLQETLDLQYAALDCYKAVADNLPSELTLRSIRFDQGRKVTFSGSGTADDRPKITEFNEKMLRVTSKEQPLFARVNPPDIRFAPGGQGVTWSFSCDLKRAEAQ